MAMNHLDKYLKFRGFLATRQYDSDDGVDIREKVLGLSHSQPTIGYIEGSLKSGNAANMRLLFPDAVALGGPDWQKSRHFLITGNLFPDEQHSHIATMRMFEEQISLENAVLFELGFLTSTHSWSHAFKSGDPKMACLGYVYDDLAHYYMADYPNRLIRKLNSDEELTGLEHSRVRALIDRIVRERISKYNAQPMDVPVLADGFNRRVLVCDQSFADASTVYGKIDEAGFERMLLAAIQENPGAEIIVKSHPDTSWEKEKRVGYYSHLKSTGRVRILRDPVNPFVLFDMVDTVYVGSSQMGLEALFAGKKVVCFGAPFYAGWGLTDDRQSIPHRHRSRTLEDIFHYFYVWYTIYHVPGRPVPSSVEDVLDFIEDYRPYPAPPSDEQAAAPPKVSIIIPVYNVEAYLEQCLTSIQRQTLKEIEIITINDCSPDGSQEIIDRLATTDRRIKPIILTENIGQGFARNAGIEAARGEYLWFLDSDDWMPNRTFLEQAYRTAKHNGSDMVRGQKLYEAIEGETGEIDRLRDDVTERPLSLDIPRTDFASTPEILHNRHFWTWMYRREFLAAHGIHFEMTRWEERPFLLKALVSAETVTLTSIEAVRYRVRPNSTARRPKSDQDIELLTENFDRVRKQLLDLGAADLDSPYRYHLRFTLTQYLHYRFLGGPYEFLSGIKDEEALEQFLDHLADALRECRFDAESVCLDPVSLSRRHKDSGAYGLLTAALLAGQYEWIETAVRLRSVRQDDLYDTLLRAPSSKEQEQLQSALNRYARNGLAARQKKRRSGPATVPRIVIHAGSTKTGSTYLQHIMESNRAALLKSGIWYPEVGLFWQADRPHKQAGHAGFATAAIRQERHLRKYIDSGLAWLGESIHTIVLSSEAFFLNARSEELARYFHPFDVEMIVYLRRQDEWANSQYAEFVAGGAVGRVDVPIHEWLDDPATKDRLDYRNHLRRWSERIGVDNVKVRIFERDQMQERDLLADFAEAAGLPELPKIVSRDGADTNEAQLPTPHVDLIRFYNSKPFQSARAYFRFIEEVTTKTAEWRHKNGKPLPKPWMITDTQADALMARFSEANAEIARTYLDRDDGKLFQADRRKPTEETELYDEEREIVAAAYEKAAPREEVNLTAGLLSLQPDKPRIVNYGAFGWRLWVLSPLVRLKIARQSRRKSEPGILEEFDREPAEFIRRKWGKKRPWLSRALYPKLDALGPARVLRVWVPIWRPIVKRRKGPEEAARFKADPVLFVRQQKKPVARALGRIFFPNGELRGHGPRS